ncbi:geminin coiled-coil domain-containing protein 1 [Seriola lalandi dorsalis]|uniref:geminin coiled-coil domain-containing protein 1 n=1 Tax=Seriola lalandi dorsalis TaxID=1841481 RepID=UPI000C6F5ACA|nr:geminin coiled-coil domain-containing protein 1 [Seriola lalandi dorsalis]XP_056230535.1 geminin coiled-coil domain-containing protein 1 [Seriola aureovittata]
METLASVWTHDPCDPRDLRDLGEKQHEPSSVWESQSVFSSSPPAGLMWTEQLSPHLQRNKQLQDTLLQRDEELARLQEENNKLRAFLSSSFVTTLEQKAKKLTADGRKKLKRNLTYMDEGPFLNCGHQFVASQPVSKRVCRNLTAEFCSESSEASASSEPQLDIWVLRTLGLKDRDTIDTSNDSLSSLGYSLRGLVYDTAVSSSSSSSGYTLNSLSPSVSTSTPSSAHSYCQSSTCQPEYRYSAAKCQEAICGDPAKSAQTCTTSPDPHSDFTATAPTRQYEAPEAVTRSYNTLPFTQSPDRAEICSITASSRAQTLEGNSAYWSPPTGSQTPSEDTFQFSSPAERIHFSPILSSTPVSNQPWTTGCSRTNLSAGSQPPVMPQTPRGRTDLAFSMSLCPSSSVKTHSFPQGQAFIRKDTEGRWNFTWVPRQGP